MKTQFAFYAHAKANDLTFGLQTVVNAQGAIYYLVKLAYTNVS